MRKYLLVFSLSIQNEFSYRLNFIFWRFRNVLRVLMTIFLWNMAFTGRSSVFGYSQLEVSAYILLVLFIQAIVMAAPSNDSIGGEIGNGDLSNYLTKPIGYLKYWLTRDIASKCLNTAFSVLEILFLLRLFKFEITLNVNPLNLFLGVISLLLAALLFFVFTKIAIFYSFWVPENTWGLMFTILVFMEVLSGMIFPLDILPEIGQALVKFTPFPYMIYYPTGILIGKFDPQSTISIILATLGWVIGSTVLAMFIWKRGLKQYSSYGR